MLRPHLRPRRQLCSCTDTMKWVHTGGEVALCHPCAAHYLQLMGMPSPMSKGQMRSPKLFETLAPFVFSIRELQGHRRGVQV